MRVWTQKRGEVDFFVVECGLNSLPQVDTIIRASRHNS
jgi:hypothetical protein